MITESRVCIQPQHIEIDWLYNYTKQKRIEFFEKKKNSFFSFLEISRRVESGHSILFLLKKKTLLRDIYDHDLYI